MKNLSEIIEFFDLGTNPSRGNRGINQNEASILMNRKNSTYYLRMNDLDVVNYTKLKAGKLGGSIYLVLNNHEGIVFRKRTNSSKSSEFNNRDLVRLIARILSPESLGEEKYNAIIQLESVEKNHSESIFRVIGLKK